MDDSEHSPPRDETLRLGEWTLPAGLSDSFSRERLSRKVLGSIFDEELGPSQLAHYRLLSKLGAGGMGVVYAAVDERLGRTVAIKLLRESTNLVAKRRLIREARALARLSHPNVVQIHDIGDFEGQVFIVMEFVGGTDLRTWLAGARRTPDEILEVFLAAGLGLQAAHERGLVHRDFKPANIMLGEDGRVRVVDFGLACGPKAGQSSARVDNSPEALWSLDQSTQLTEAGAVIGTPAYMAPEQLRGHETDAKTDQFSFCVALWEALYRSRPFEGRSIGGLLEAISGGHLREVERDNIPDWLRRVVARGLAADPARRWPSLGALLAALRRSPERSRAGRRRFMAAAAMCLASLGMGLWTRGVIEQQFQPPEVVAPYEDLPIAESEERWPIVPPLGAEPPVVDSPSTLTQSPTDEANPASPRSVSPRKSKPPRVNRHSSKVAPYEAQSTAAVQIESRIIPLQRRSILSNLRPYGVARQARSRAADAPIATNSGLLRTSDLRGSGPTNTDDGEDP